MRAHVTSLIAVFGAAAGCVADDAAAVSIALSNVGPGLDGHAGATLSIAGADGEPIAAGPGNTTVAVQTRGGGGAWQPATDVQAAFDAAPRLDVMFVADNSGSTRAALDAMQGALRHVGHVLLAVDRHRVGLVRVSTTAQVVQPPTTSAADLEGAIDRLFVSNGWTALWDGVRQANEALDAHQTVLDGAWACFPAAAPTIVVFTDGRDNNSADEQPSRYPGDGVDTRLEDLLALTAGPRTTAVHTIGVTAAADEEALTLLAESTGGRYLRLANYGQLVAALQTTAHQLDALVPVCFRPASCAHDEARVVVRVKHGKAWTEHEAIVALPPTCPAP